MKTDILQLEQHDDFLTILDKLQRCKSERILLVFPKKLRNRLSKVDLRRLQYTAIMQGSSIAIVTSNRVTLVNTREMRIPSFSEVSVALRHNWERVEKREPLRSIQGYTAIQQLDNDIEHGQRQGQSSTLLIRLLTVVISATLASLFLFTVPSIHVTVYPQVEFQKLALEIHAATDTATANITGSIPLYIGELTLEGTLSKQSTGTISFPLTRASGEVTLVNLANEAIRVPEGFTLHTIEDPQIRFSISQPIEVPPGDQEISMTFFAIEPGSFGNISLDELLVVEGDLAAQVSVVSHSAFAGGDSRDSATPSEADYQNLRKDILEDLARKAEAQAMTIHPGALLETIQLTEVIREEQSFPIESPSDLAELTLSVVYSYRYYDPEDIYRIGRQLMDQALASTKVAASDEIIIIEQTKPSVSESNASWKVVLQRKIGTRLDVAKLKQILKGKRLTEGLAILDRQIVHFRPAEIQHKFLIIDWFPMFSERIIVEEANENPG